MHQDVVIENDNMHFTVLCRLCATRKTDIVQIYHSASAHFDFELKINKHLPIMVDRDDKLPLGLCSDCCVALLSFDELYTTCQTADRNLKELLLISEESCDNNSIDESRPCNTVRSLHTITGNKGNSLSKSVSSLIIVPRNNHSEPTKNNEVAEKSSSLSALLVKNNKISIADEANREKDSCVREAKSEAESNYAPHDKLTTELEEESPSDEDPDVNDISDDDKSDDSSINKIDLRMCGSCGCMMLKKFVRKHTLCCPGKEEMDKIMKRTDENETVTAIQKKLTEMLLDREKETLLKSVAVKNYGKYSLVGDNVICDMCKKVCEDMLRFSQHRKRECPFSHYECKYCGVSYRLNESLKRHLATCHELVKGDYRCGHCGKSYAIKKSLDYHVHTVHVGARDIKCEQCSVTFKRKDHYRRHQISKHNRPKLVAETTRFICSICSAQFSNDTRFRAHALKHNGTKTSVCEKCGKSFFAESGLKYHQTRNPNCVDVKVRNYATKQKEYVRNLRQRKPRFQCDLCNRAFHFRFEMNRHIRSVHLNETTYGCKMCSMKFRSYGILQRHTRNAHTRPLYACEICSRSFSLSELRNHMESHRMDRILVCPR